MGGSEFRSIDKSVALRVTGLTKAAPGLLSDGEVVVDVGVVTIDIPGPEGDDWGKRGREDAPKEGDGVTSECMRADAGRG